MKVLAQMYERIYLFSNRTVICPETIRAKWRIYPEEILR